MAIAGVKTETNQSGHFTSVTIDVQQHKEVLPVLREMGLIEKTQFERECEEGMSVEEFGERLKAHIRKVWNK